MAQRPISPCYLCRRFRRRDDAPPGHGYCDGYERMQRYDDTNEACPLWNRARDEAARRKWAERQEKST